MYQLDCIAARGEWWSAGGCPPYVVFSLDRRFLWTMS